MKTRTEKVVDVQEWDKLVSETYGRPYSFQQQGGCMDRGVQYLSVPCEIEAFECAHVKEQVNGPERGVSLEAWLSRDPSEPLADDNIKDQWATNLWWYRNFYPSLSEVANDLHSKGLLEAGEYMINIDW